MECQWASNTHSVCVRISFRLEVTMLVKPLANQTHNDGF